MFLLVSGGKFYDTNNSATIDANTAREENVHTFSANNEANNLNEGIRYNYGKGLRQAEINFLTKLRQRQRQRQLIPAMEISSREQQELKQPMESVAVIDNLLDGLLGNPDNDISDQSSLENDLATVVRYLAQKREESLSSQGSSEQGSDEFSGNGQKRAAALRTSMSRRSHSFPYNKERFSPSISVGEFYGTVLQKNFFYYFIATLNCTTLFELTYCTCMFFGVLGGIKDV